MAIWTDLLCPVKMRSKGNGATSSLQRCSVHPTGAGTSNKMISSIGARAQTILLIWADQELFIVVEAPMATTMPTGAGRRWARASWAEGARTDPRHQLVSAIWGVERQASDWARSTPTLSSIEWLSRGSCGARLRRSPLIAFSTSTAGRTTTSTWRIWRRSKRPQPNSKS